MNSTKFFSLLSLQVIIIFMTVILVSFIPDSLHDFFGDWVCKGGYYDKELQYFVGCNHGNGSHDPELHWGYRHWIWCLMGFVLFVLQCIRVGLFINKTEITQ